MAESTQQWQSRLAGYSLKKRAKFAAIARALGPLGDVACLEVGCGPGASGLMLESLGGQWLHADPELARLAEADRVLPGRTTPMSESAVPGLADASFNLIVAVDLMEHLDKEAPLLAELSRLLKPGGRLLVTTPRLRPWSTPAILRKLLRLHPRVFGHYRDGYTPRQLADLLLRSGFRIVRQETFLGPVTSSIETLIDGVYYWLFGRWRAKGQWSGSSQIGPSSGAELERHGAAFQLYRVTFPLIWLVSRVDCLLPRGRGYGVLIEARKP